MDTDVRTTHIIGDRMVRITSARLRSARQCAMVAILAVSPVLLAGAQKICLTPTQKAQVNISWFLHAPENKPWRDSLGITARSVTELQSLTDADSTLCRRMDSTIVDKPAYYYRAGRYILGSNFPDSTGRKLQSEYDETNFVFDSLGRPVPRTSKQWLVAPHDVQLMLAAPGQVTLSWVNRSNGVVSYQLQRAGAGAAFVAVGVPFSGSATTVTDPSAAAGNTYQYRLAALGSASDTAYSNVLTATIVPQGTLTRTSTGLLYQDQFNLSDDS